MLTVEELSERLEPVTFEDFEGDSPPTWRYQWGPIMFLLEKIESINLVYTGTVAILGSSSQFRIPVSVKRRRGSKPTEEDLKWARDYALDRMVDHVRDLNPKALQEAVDFLLNEEAPPTGKPALERISED